MSPLVPLSGIAVRAITVSVDSTTMMPKSVLIEAVRSCRRFSAAPPAAKTPTPNWRIAPPVMTSPS